MRGMYPGVGIKLLAGLALLSAFITISGGLAVYSFNQLHTSFNRVASTQLDIMIAAAKLRQESEVLTSLAPSLFARDITKGSLANFATRTFRLLERHSIGTFQHTENLVSHGVRSTVSEPGVPLFSCDQSTSKTSYPGPAEVLQPRATTTSVLRRTSLCDAVSKEPETR